MTPAAFSYELEPVHNVKSVPLDETSLGSEQPEHLYVAALPTFLSFI